MPERWKNHQRLNVSTKIEAVLSSLETLISEIFVVADMPNRHGQGDRTDFLYYRE
jgi:hypothetical protein